MNIAKTNAALKIERSKTQMVLMEPFWASLILRMDIEVKPPEWFEAMGRAPTTATNGTTIFYCEDFINGLPSRQVEAVLAQNVGRAMLLHHLRRDWREKDMWDEAGRPIVNKILKDSGFEMPPNSVFDPELEDKTAEQAYAIVDKRHKQKQNKNGKGNGQGGRSGDDNSSVMDHEGGAADKAHEEQEWQIAVQQAANVAKQAGNLPASMERLLDELKKPQIDWITVLREFFEEVNPKDWVWFPSNRRFVANGDYLPSIEKEGCGRIVVAVDTSGSIDQEMLRQFVSEINAIMNEVKPTEIHVIYCDTAIGHVDVFQEGEPIVINAVGGGGTHFDPPFVHCTKNDLRPKCFIYLTDLQGDVTVPEPDFPVLWVTQDANLNGKFGQTLRMPLGNQA